MCLSIVPGRYVDKPDGNDIHRKRGTDALREEIDNNAERFVPNDAVDNIRASYGPPKANGRHDPEEKLVKSSAEFINDFVPPDYLIDGLLQRRFLYSLTGRTGSGKTAVALLWAYSIATGTSIGGREVQRGRVLYFAGENPDDVRQRWLAMAEHMCFDFNSIDVCFLAGVVDLSELNQRIRMEVAELGGVAAIFIDTSAAYFSGDDENSNPAMGAYARFLRSFTTCDGGPTVITNCHPTKNAQSDSLLPRGGGAFIAEVDGNLTASLSESVVTVHWQGKFRGPSFEPIEFETRSVTAARLKDARRRSIHTVIAAELSAEQIDAKTGQRRKDQDKVLTFMLEAGDGSPSIASIAERCGFLGATRQPQKSKVHGILKALKKDRLIETERDQYRLTERGKATAKKAQKQAAEGD
jgi:hypothetical protein